MLPDASMTLKSSGPLRRECLGRTVEGDGDLP
jgi:hypothetical protein